MIEGVRNEALWLALVTLWLGACGDESFSAVTPTSATPEAKAAAAPTSAVQATAPKPAPDSASALAPNEAANRCPESRRKSGTCGQLYGVHLDPEGEIDYLPDDFPKPPSGAAYCGTGKASIAKHWAYYVADLSAQQTLEQYAAALEAAGYQAEESEPGRSCDRTLKASKGGKGVAWIHVDGGLKSFTISKPY